MSLEIDLTGKVALVTGGSRGIGAACVRLFTQAGANVLFSYQKSSEAADKVVVASGSDRCAAVQADLIGEGAEQMLVEETVSRYGYLDILVVNHGIWEPHDRYVDQMDDEQWRSTMAVNLDSAFLPGEICRPRHAPLPPRRRPHRPGQLRGGTVRPALPLRLRGHQGRPHQHGQEPGSRAGA